MTRWSPPPNRDATPKVYQGPPLAMPPGLSELDQISYTWRQRFPRSEPPGTESLERFLQDLSVAALIMAIDITASRFTHAEPEGEDGLQRYFYGVCHNMIRGRDER